MTTKAHTAEVRRRQWPLSLPISPSIPPGRTGVGSPACSPRRWRQGERLETALPRRDSAALMMAHHKSSFQSERRAGVVEAYGLGWGRGVLGGWEKLGGCVVCVWGVVGERLGWVRLLFSFSVFFLFFIASRHNSTPGDDGRSKKPNLQAADGIWPTHVGLPVGCR
jgi:hypothetical protein